jgi:hypothetical protein
MTRTIAANQLFPPAFGNQAPDWLWRPKDIPKGKFQRFYVTSQVDAGYRYYSEAREVRLSKEYPTDYEKDIGYRYGHGPGKADKDGQPLLERAMPTQVILIRLWHVEERKMVACVIDSWPLMQRLQQVFENEEFQLIGDPDNGYISNFYLQVYHNANPASPSLTYTADGHLRPTQSAEALEAAAKPWYPDNYWLGLNPLEKPLQPPAAKPGLPATAYDENGAEAPLAVHSTDDEPW